MIILYVTSSAHRLITIYVKFIGAMDLGPIPGLFITADAIILISLPSRLPNAIMTSYYARIRCCSPSHIWIIMPSATTTRHAFTRVIGKPKSRHYRPRLILPLASRSACLRVKPLDM